MTHTIGRTWQLALALTAASLTACSSTSSSSPAPPAPVFTPFPVLVPGSSFRYAGKFSESITYPSPSPSQPNSLGTYTTSELVNVSTAASGAPAPVEVRRDLRYTVTKAPTSGIELQRAVTSAFETSTVTNTSQTISEAETITTTTGIDETANRIQGNGPYYYRGSVTTKYSPPRVLLVFPLVIGSTSVPLARTVATDERSANAQGDIFFSRDTTAHYSDDGAFVESGSIGPGETTRVKAFPNGTGLLVNSGTTQLREEIGLPTPGPSQKYLIPVSVTVKGVKHSYLAADWYPGAGAPPSPLAVTTQAVKGPATIPSSCNVKVPVSNVQEVETSSTALDVVAGTYDVSQTSEFLSNGNAACVIRSLTISAYDITTGALVSTAVDSFILGLTAASIPERTALTRSGP